MALIKIDETIEISVFEKDNIKRIFNSIINKEDINLENFSLNEGLNEINNIENYEYLKNIINKLTVKAYGAEEIIDKIYLFKNFENEYLNEISIFGALYSSHFPISKEAKLIFDFIDYEDNYPIKQFMIHKRIYKINKKIIEIRIDDCKIPFEDCYYRNINITFFKEIIKPKKNIITIYYNQNNYFYCSKDINKAKSAEIIFYKILLKLK